MRLKVETIHFIYVILLLSFLVFIFLKNYSVILITYSISRKYPQFLKPNISDFEKVNILRQWTFENVAWASNSLQVKQYIHNKEAPEIFKILREKETNNLGGVDCSGYAYTLMKLYKLYGYESYAYHYGRLDGWNDVITLVKIKFNGKDIIVAEQALFDAVLVYENGDPYDFFQLLRDIKMGNTKKIKIIQGSGSPHSAFCRKNDNCIYKTEKGSIPLPNNTLKFKSKFSATTLSNNLGSLLIPRVVQHSDDTDMHKKNQLLEKIKSIVIY